MRLGCEKRSWNKGQAEPAHCNCVLRSKHGFGCCLHQLQEVDTAVASWCAAPTLLGSSLYMRCLDPDSTTFSPGLSDFLSVPMYIRLHECTKIRSGSCLSFVDYIQGLEFEEDDYTEPKIPSSIIQDDPNSR